MNKHREVFYKKRREILTLFQNSALKKQTLEIIKKQGFSEADYEKKEKEVGSENMRQIEKTLSLRILDSLWMDHLENMDRLRDSVRLRAYGQRDPLVEYKNEGHKAFRNLLSTFESVLANGILKSRVTFRPSLLTDNLADSRSVSRNQYSKKKPGRNDPCPCGKKDPITGKPVKYKKCCYPKFG